jgi:hypothetical protein
MDYLLLSHDENSILSDYLNLIYIYNPLSADSTLARHVVHKLELWALNMSVFSYRMEHVMGELNCWTNLMTRWGLGLIAGEQSAWKDGQPRCTGVHQPARLRYSAVSVEEGDSTGAAERCQ